MQTARVRVALSLSVFVLAALAAPGSASALPPSSQIGTPAGITYPVIEPGKKITIAGTAVGLTEVDIRCYTGTEEFSSNLVAEKVPVKAGAFSTEALLGETEGPLGLYPAVCQLRAVPVGEKAVYPPGTTSAFEGPLIVASDFTPEGTYTYFASSSTLVGSFFFESAGTYGVESVLYSSLAHSDQKLFYGEADLEWHPPIATRSSVQVDGANGFVPEAAHAVENKLSIEAKKPIELPGKPVLTVTRSFDEAHQITIHEEDPVVKCSPGTEFPPTAKGCTSWVPTGVTLVRTLQSSDEDRLGSVTDTWRSTDGAAHTVSARYYTEQYDQAQHSTYQFPGEAAFAATTTGEKKTLPAGPGMILYKSVPALSDAGNGEDPQGAIVYDSAPSEPMPITTGSNSSSVASVFEMPYSRTVPAGGSSAPLRMAFAQSFSMTEARTLAEGALARFYPSVAIASPANGSATSSPTATVSGTATDGVGLASFTVNGAAVAVGAGGAWSAGVALKPGANTITATAINQSGLTASATETVTYTPSVAGKVGAPNGSGGKVTVKLACHGLAGSSCKIRLTLTTVEKLRHGHLVGIAAARTKSKTVTVGSLVVTIPAGSTRKVTIKLNRTGRRLLGRFHRIPSKLSAVLEGPAGKTPVFTQTITVKAPKKHKH